jgi:hypothetical protein
MFRSGNSCNRSPAIFSVSATEIKFQLTALKLKYGYSMSGTLGELYLLKV